MTNKSETRPAYVIAKTRTNPIATDRPLDKIYAPNKSSLQRSLRLLCHVHHDIFIEGPRVD